MQSCRKFQGDIDTAMGFHERHQELAKAIDVPEEQAMACAELMKVPVGPAQPNLKQKGIRDDFNFFPP